jgi:hypothetical protein
MSKAKAFSLSLHLLVCFVVLKPTQSFGVCQGAGRKKIFPRRSLNYFNKLAQGKARNYRQDRRKRRRKAGFSLKKYSRADFSEK